MSVLIVSLFIMMATCCIDGATKDDDDNIPYCLGPMPILKPFSKFKGKYYVQRIKVTNKDDKEMKDVTCLAYNNDLTYSFSGFLVKSYIKDGETVEQSFSWGEIRPVSAYSGVLGVDEVEDEVDRFSIIYANDNGDYVMTICPGKSNDGLTGPTEVVVCTKARDANKTVIDSLVEGAKKSGLDTTNMVAVKQTNCPKVPDR